ncbi:histone deacetylase [Kribbella sp. NPDC050470]|uniref:histone deacetylase n=1 Tax=unclassified Kribbella TaxID=2644121 RepID=UPI0037931D80
MDHVWYVAYGSNLALDRFRCYLAGGRPAGGARVYPGCRDPRDPARIAAVEVPGGLVFAGESRVWGGGSAFYNPAAPGVVAARAYLVTADQLGDIAAQEMRRDPGGEFARDLAAVLPEVDAVHAMGSGRYETVARLGEQDGVPMFTVTHGTVADLEPNAPTLPYLRWIAAGLAEAHGWAARRVAEYLYSATGVSRAWTVDELASALDGEAGGGGLLGGVAF